MADVAPLITVIIPTFRRPKSLQRAILSVLDQTFSAFRVDVYDDASNDTTKKVVTELAELDPRVKYHCHERTIGAAANFNYGLQQVDTPFFVFLSDDDLLLPQFFEMAMRSLSVHPDVMFYAGLTIEVKNNTITGVFKNGGRFGYFSPPDGLLELVEHQLMWNAIVFRSEVVHSVGLLDVDVGGPVDIDFEFRIAAHHPFIVSAEPSALYILHASNVYAQSSDYRLYLHGFTRIINKLMSDESLSLDTKVQIKKRLYTWLADLLVALAVRASLKGEYHNVSAIADILARFCHRRAIAFLLVGQLRLKQSSELASFFATWIERWLHFVSPINMIRKIKLRQVQRKYRAYLRDLDV